VLLEIAKYILTHFRHYHGNTNNMPRSHTKFAGIYTTFW